MISLAGYKNQWGTDTIDFRGWYHFTCNDETNAIFFWDFVPTPPPGYTENMIGPFESFERAKKDATMQWAEVSRKLEDAVQCLELLTPERGKEQASP